MKLPHIKNIFNKHDIRIVTNCMYIGDIKETITLSFDKKTPIKEIENKLFNSIINILCSRCTRNNNLVTFALSLYRFTQPVLYINGIETDYKFDNPSIHSYREAICNVNLRKLQWILNHQYTNCNFPIDRAVRNSNEWEKCGGISKLPSPT